MDTHTEGTTKLSKKAAIALIDRLWGAIQRCAERGIDTDRRWDDLNRLTLVQEKEHVGFGRRLIGREPERATPIRTRARYFAIKAVLCPPACPKSWGEVGMYRNDIVAGAILRAMFEDNEATIRGFALGHHFDPKDLGMFNGLDYAEDLAR